MKWQKDFTMRLFKFWVWVLSIFLLSGSLYASPRPIHWQEWSRPLFKRAEQEHKLVLVYGRVSWCHWCQQMESSTFADPQVERIVNARFIPIRVDVENDQS